MASDFDAHLKNVMGSLTNDITKAGLNKSVAVLKAKKALAEILQRKALEYVAEIKDNAIYEIFQEIGN